MSVALEDIVSPHREYMAQNGESLGIYLFIYILLISFLPNISNKKYHDTGDNQLSTEHIRGLSSISLCQLMELLRPKTCDSLAIFFLSILLILCLPNISNKFYHGTG